MTKFEQRQKLYKVSPSTGKIQVWFGWTFKDKVHCSYGELDGKMQVNTYTAFPKNESRSNATTAEEQAKVELEAMYQSQIDNKHYKLSTEEAIEANKVCRIPRKITNYKDRFDKMSKTLLSSRKKNGSRGCAVEGILYSKIGRPEDVKVSHLKAVLEELGSEATFDSEIYAEGLSLQRIRSAFLKPVKTDKEIIKIAKDRAKSLSQEVPTPDGKVELSDAIKYLGYNPNDDQYKLKFWVFDIPSDTDADYRERLEWVKKFEDKIKQKKLDVYFEFIYPVETKSHEERMKLLEEVCEEGDEGLVHYEPTGVYEYGKRSTNTAKSKPRLDGEARVVDVTADRSGQGVLHCVTSDSLGKAKFKCKMKGSAEERSFENMKLLINKWINFKYEELSDKGVPTKPVAESLRNCDENGEPLE
ncbi:hypothetical protein [Vibrio phage vB_VibM_10AMN]|uniref:DNA ligase n=1 Tax=Staphylococcus phage vB_VibM_10AMN12 TaxID=3076785 RepID=A0AA96QZK5_9CAUD|nr:hypothetical protein [Vibrio phage vB_VibM_10AMN]WNO47573.1 hypothetical protein [Staphylococcus phage vB_VibM_10AMN12]